MDIEQRISGIMQKADPMVQPPPVAKILQAARRRRVAVGVRWTMAIAVVVAGSTYAGLRSDTSSLRFASPGTEDVRKQVMPCPAPSAEDAQPPSYGWRALPPMPEPARNVAFAAVAGGVLTAQNGSDGAFSAWLQEGATEWQCQRLPHTQLGQQPRLVSAGNEIFLWTGSGKGDVLTFDPDGQAWRPLAPFPLTDRIPAVVQWTDQGMLVWGGRNSTRTTAHRDGALYDPDTGEWSVIASAPHAFTMVASAWNGDDLWVVGSLLDSNNIANSPVPQVLAYTPAHDEWRVAPSPPLSPQAYAAAWTNEGLLVWDYLLQASLLPTDRQEWQALPELPFAPMECYPQSAVAGTLVYAVFCGRVALWEAGAGWRELTAPAALLEGIIHDHSELLLLGSSEIEAPQRLFRRTDSQA